MRLKRARGPQRKFRNPGDSYQGFSEGDSGIQYRSIFPRGFTLLPGVSKSWECAQGIEDAVHSESRI